MLCLQFLCCWTLNQVSTFNSNEWEKNRQLSAYDCVTTQNLDVLLDGLQNSLPVFCSLQSDLFSDNISVLPLYACPCFGLCLDAQQLIFVSQLHLMLYRGCKRTHHTSVTSPQSILSHVLSGYTGVTVLRRLPFLMASCFFTDSSCLRRFSSFKTCC